MSLAVVQMPDIQKAVGQAAILLSSDRRYFDAELGLVLPRLIVAAQAQQMLFVIDNEVRMVRSFCSFAFLDPDCAMEWRHRKRSPSFNDVKAGDNCWLMDYSWASEDDGKLLADGIRQRFPGKGAAVSFHNEPAQYPEFRVVTFGDKK